jgi:WD domain, G-beta repeat
MTTRTTPSTDVDERQTTLEALAQALRRETYVLAERPELTWQQLHNRLQWADPPLIDHLAAGRERRSRPGADPWIHNHTRRRESEALIRSLAGHTGSVFACAVSPDGTWIVSASGDNTLKIWDAGSPGREGDGIHGSGVGRFGSDVPARARTAHGPRVTAC